MVANKINFVDKSVGCPALFGPVVRSATYTAQLDFYKKHISGLFLFKSMNDTTERVVFMTETGFKFFDFEYTPHCFKVQYILPGLNKKIIVNTLHKDLGYLLVPPFESSALTQYQSDTSIIYKFPVSKGNTYYTSDKKCTKLEKIEVGNDRKKSLIIDLTDTQNMGPETINITHQNFKLTIFMKQIKN